MSTNEVDRLTKVPISSFKPENAYKIFLIPINWLFSSLKPSKDPAGNLIKEQMNGL